MKSLRRFLQLPFNLSSSVPRVCKPQTHLNIFFYFFTEKLKMYISRDHRIVVDRKVRMCIHRSKTRREMGGKKFLLFLSCINISFSLFSFNKFPRAVLFSTIIVLQYRLLFSTRSLSIVSFLL